MSCWALPAPSPPHPFFWTMLQVAAGPTEYARNRPRRAPAGGRAHLGETTESLELTLPREFVGAPGTGAPLAQPFSVTLAAEVRLPRAHRGAGWLRGARGGRESGCQRPRGLLGALCFGRRQTARQPRTHSPARALLPAARARLPLHLPADPLLSCCPASLSSSHVGRRCWSWTSTRTCLPARSSGCWEAPLTPRRARSPSARPSPAAGPTAPTRVGHAPPSSPLRAGSSPGGPAPNAPLAAPLLGCPRAHPAPAGSPRCLCGGAGSGVEVWAHAAPQAGLFRPGPWLRPWLRRAGGPTHPPAALHAVLSAPASSALPLPPTYTQPPTDTHTLAPTRCPPCAGTSVELDPECQVEVAGAMAESGMVPVGWYHSHPVFEARPR
jgi:hypothetical protein